MRSRRETSGPQPLLVTSSPLQVRLLLAVKGSLRPVATAAAGSRPQTQPCIGTPRFRHITDHRSGRQGLCNRRLATRVPSTCFLLASERPRKGLAVTVLSHFHWMHTETSAIARRVSKSLSLLQPTGQSRITELRLTLLIRLPRHIRKAGITSPTPSRPLTLVPLQHHGCQLPLPTVASQSHQPHMSSRSMPSRTQVDSTLTLPLTLVAMVVTRPSTASPLALMGQT